MCFDNIIFFIDITYTVSSMLNLLTLNNCFNLLFKIDVLM